MKHTREELKQWQALPLSIKVRMTEQRVRDWVHEYGEEGCYVSFSGGKDSTVLLDIVRNRMGYTNVPAVFVDTGLEYPEIREFVKTFDNVVWLKPKMNFRQVIEKYGYPFISKEVCESVYGAKQYLKKLLEYRQTDRQTDRQMDLPYRYWYERVTGTGVYAKKQSTIPKCDKLAIETNTPGGNDNKYRKVRGIGEYSKRTNAQKTKGSESAVSNNVGNADERQETSDSGEYP